MISVTETPEPRTGDALVLVDVQNDFLPGGALAVPAADQIIEPANRWLSRFAAAARPIFATRDWHPSQHCSFHAQGGPWPPHCIADTRGAQFSAALRWPAAPAVVTISKGTQVEADAYSGFQDTDLHERLQAATVRRVFVGGLATDYCVLNTVLDARRLGYAVVLLESAVRAVEVHPGDGMRAMASMSEAGATAVKD